VATGVPTTIAALLTLGGLASAASVAPQPRANAGAVLSANATSDQIARGRQLFDGSIRLARGGPACAACHAAATVPAAGGTMGPDLTGVTARMGPEGLASALQTLYFPTMYPLFAAHQLTPAEQGSIGAFLESTGGQTSHAVRDTISIAAGAAIGCAILFAVTGLLGRSRVSSVRRTRLPRSTPGGSRNRARRGATA
jgi:mono/diheme cytochrome c family protein